jgi:chromosome segregation ATPase
MAAPEVVLQAVLMSFDAQGVSTDKLIEAARHYKEVIKQKNDDFLKGAESERNNQLQKRQTALQTHTDALQKLQQQIQQLEQQKQQLEQSMNKEKTQLEVDKTLGKEGIEKIEKAESLITTAHEYMQSTIVQISKD